MKHIKPQPDHKIISRSTRLRFATLPNGFTVVELLITLFIAAAFLVSGFQLYAVIIKNGGQARAQARASNVAYDYLQRYKPSATDPCTAQTPLTNQSLTVSGLSIVTATVVISCPYGSSSSISKVLVTLQYNNPQQTVSNATYINPPDTVTDGLVLSLDAGNTSSVKGRKSIINWDSWTVSVGGVSGYSVNGDGNSRVMDTNPWGASDVVWDVSNQDAANDADGGWNGSSFSIDTSKMYRFTTWVRRKTIGDGRFYLGTSGGGASVLNRSDGAVNGNPYFFNDIWWGPVNQWYLVVGYVWPAGSGTGAVMPESGVYALDGTKIASSSNFVWQSTTTSSMHRSFLYYSIDTTTNQQWYQPRVDVVDGTEPTVTELRNNSGNTWYDLSGNGYNGTLLNGVSYTSANSGALNFDGVNDYVSFANNTLELGTGDFTIDLFAYIGDSTYAWQRLFGKKGVGGAEQGYSAYWGGANQKLMWSTANGSAGHEYWTNGTITINTWHHIVMVRNSSDARIGYYYVDGQREDVSTVPVIDNVTKSTAVPYAGSLGGTSLQFEGSISSIRVYNRALNANEIQQNFNALRGRYGV